MTLKELPFVLARYGPDTVPLFAGTDPTGQLVGITVPDGEPFTVEPEDVLAAMSIDPAAVYWGLQLRWAEVEQRQAAEAVKRAATYKARGPLFDPYVVPVTGYPADTLLRHRTAVPSLDTVRLSAIFAVSTIRTSIEQAEQSFNCFVELYEERRRESGARWSGELPDIADIRDCFRGLQNSKSRMFYEVAEYAPVIQDAITRGLHDGELRRYLVRETDLPAGLGVTKMSFTLALLGHDCACLDARLLVRMFGTRAKATEIESGWGKTGAHVSELGLRRYEKVEEAFLAGNPFYDSSDPLGRARAQWMSWESVGGEAAKHAVWLNVVS